MRTHLRPDELIDLVEGARAETSVPHLASCERCRRQLAELRTTLAAMTSEEVPEPSPLFWTQLQARVSERIADEGAAARFPSLAWLLQPRLLVPVGAVAAVAVALSLSVAPRVTLPPLPNETTHVAPPLPNTSEPSASARLELLNDSLPADDPSLQLVADLTATLDWNQAGDAGLAAHGSAEHAVTHLSAAELAELRRILQQELSKAGN